MSFFRYNTNNLYIGKKMTSNEIRQSFLDFFKSKGHSIVPSAPVIPHGDPTLLFTNAGMNQFKDVFLGIGTRDYNRAADTQKCIRVSGKHNDLEEVGIDTYHHTFFEMLGNWSFGDYYKNEAIEWAWELLTKVWNLDPNRLHATVYRTDDEAYSIWEKFLPKSRIHRFDEKDNFWEMGDTGPCGPCSEIHYDRTPDLSGGNLVNAGSSDVIEIWNLVFIQYNRKSNGELEPLSAKHVDTGMGFERICSVIQNKNSNYDTDVFTPIIEKISELTNKEYDSKLDSPISIAMRVIADHIRTLSFAIADGALPGNEGRGYVLRRILRRALRFAKNLGISEPIIYKLVPTLVEKYKDVFPELSKNQELISKVLRSEEESFLITLDRGLQKFDEFSKDKNIVSGEDAFLLFDTFGFPLDLTQLIARERGLSVDTKRFEELMEEQKNRSRLARKKLTNEIDLPILNYNTEFIGYTEFNSQSKILYVNENMLVADKTPFYSESGGQVSDTGIMMIDGIKYNVIDVKKSGNAIIHIADRDIDTKSNTVYLEIDIERRRKIMRNHSATHLLHEALRKVLGNHVQQAGSLVAPDYLRFDFNHFEKVSKEQLQEIERIVNQKIFQNIPVYSQVIPIQEAKKNDKIKMFFGDKYGENVRLITMDPNYSLELCGGTHVNNTAEIGIFKIISESSIAAGVRRIEAITGDSVENYINTLNNNLNNKEAEINILINKIKELEKLFKLNKINNLKDEILKEIEDSRLINSNKIYMKKINNLEIEDLRDLADDVRNKIGKELILLLATVNDDKVHLVCAVTDDLKNKYPASKLISIAAQFIGGNGGGKPHLATAGAKNIDKLDKLLKQFPNLVNEF